MIYNKQKFDFCLTFHATRSIQKSTYPAVSSTYPAVSSTYPAVSSAELWLVLRVLNCEAIAHAFQQPRLPHLGGVQVGGYGDLGTGTGC